MQAKLTINGVDFAKWCKEDGITQSDIVRQGRSVVVLDGTEYRGEIHKRGLQVSLVEVRDQTLRTLLAALTSPAEVAYTDMTGEDRQRVFYVSSPTATAKTVRGGNTYYSGVSFSLEER